MTAVDKTPSNRNFLPDKNFKFAIKKTPNVNFFLTKVNLPGLYLKEVNVGSPFVKVPYPGEHINFNPLVLEFIVDENLLNYQEIWDWLIALGKPESYEQYKAIADIKPITGEGIYSDASVFVLTSTYLANYEFVFKDLFPIELSDIQLRSDNNDLRYLTCTAKFKYTTYEIISL